MDQKVIKVDHALFSVDVSQNPLHKSVKRGGSIEENLALLSIESFTAPLVQFLDRVVNI